MKRKEKRRYRYVAPAAAPRMHPAPESSSAPAPCRLHSFGRELPDFSSHQEVHHRFIAFFHGKQLRDLHVSASALFPACHLSHRFPECFLLVSPPAAGAEEALQRLGRYPWTQQATMVLSVAEPF